MCSEAVIQVWEHGETRQQGQEKGNAVPAGPDPAWTRVPGLLHAWLGTCSSGLAERRYESSLLCLLTLEVKVILCRWRDRLVKGVTLGLSCPRGHQACPEPRSRSPSVAFLEASLLASD